MAPLTPYICVTGLGQVRSVSVPDSSKPNSYHIYCDFNFKKAGFLTIPVSKYCESGESVSLNGPIWLPEGTDGSIEADSLEIITNDNNAGLRLPSPSVYAVGTVSTVIGRDIYMDVGAYSRDARSTVTYKIIVAVPNDRRRANMRMPQTGSNISVRGILSDIAVHEDVASIELENLTYLPRTDFSNARNEGSPSGKTKRQLIAEKSQDSIDVGRPMKKTKSGPIDAFTAEELGAGSSSTPGAGSSSEFNVESSGSNAESSGSNAESSAANVESSPDLQADSSPSPSGASSARMTRNAESISGRIAASKKDGKSTKKA